MVAGGDLSRSIGVYILAVVILFTIIVELLEVWRLDLRGDLDQLVVLNQVM